MLFRMQFQVKLSHAVNLLVRHNPQHTVYMHALLAMRNHFTSSHIHFDFHFKKLLHNKQSIVRF